MRDEVALYHNKGSEELSAILNQYKDNYESRFGQSPHDLKAKLEAKLKEQQEKHFNSVFGQLTPHDLATLIDLIQPEENKPVDQTKPKKGNKKSQSVNDNSSQNQG